MSKVIVAHPNAQHSFHLAIGLQQGGLLHKLITRLYTSWHHPPFAWGRWLPVSARLRVEQQFFARFRRQHPALNPTKVQVVDTALVLGLIALRRGKLITSAQSGVWLRRTSERFQRRVAQITLAKQADVLVCYDRFAYTAFTQLKETAVTKVLDLSIAHPITLRNILLTEKETHPALANTLDIAGVTDKGIEQVSQETELADFILVASQFVKNSCVANGMDPQKIFVVPYGAELGSFPPKKVNNTPPKRPFRALFVGRIEQRKGISYLLDAFKQIASPEIELWLCGNMLVQNMVLQQYKGTYRHLGFVPHSQLAEIYQQVDVLVFPSLVEGYGLVILEAMAAGLPVIATSHTGGPDIITDGQDGFIIPIRDIQAIAEKVLFLKQNPQICAKMSIQAQQTIKKFTWQRYYDKIGEVFQEILVSHE
jgi:alpha-maltose-1-phosphate synthase